MNQPTTYLARRFAELSLPHVRLGTGPTPVSRLDLDGLATDVWVKNEASYGDGRWGGNKVRKLEWIIPNAHRKGKRTLLTVGGIGTHWGLAAALYGREHGLRVVLGLVDQPVDDHVREQLARLEASGAHIHRFASVPRLKAAAPYLVARYIDAGGVPYYLPAGGSSPVGTLAYVEAALEIGEQVRAGQMPEPAVVVTAVGSGGTAAGLMLGLKLAGLNARVLGVVVNDALRLDAPTLARLANRTRDVLKAAGASISTTLTAADVTASSAWMGATYGASTHQGQAALEVASTVGLALEPVYTAKALAAIRDLDARGALAGPALYLQTHGPRGVIG